MELTDIADLVVMHDQPDFSVADIERIWEIWDK